MGLVGRCFLLSLAAFGEVGRGGTPVVREVGPWRHSGRVDISWSLRYDSLTVVRLLVVTGVSTLVHLYSTSYREGDPHRPRFRSYLSLFTFFRVVLVTAGNFVQRFVGWEGVGLCSYLLINFWFTRLQANKAAIKARLVNRVGDFGLVLGRLAVYRTFGTLDYSAVFALAPTGVGQELVFWGTTRDARTLIGVLLFVGAVGKSAQLGLHTWLPDAREGPTPVSALIHAATRVTAGVFLLARCSPLLEYAPTALAVVTVVGACTAFFAATTGLLQNDRKRVIAYSTCSQLGYRIFACGLSAYPVAVFHLANHAVFKALLFLGAGSVIHARADEQDRRRRGGLVRVLPLTYAARFIGSVALRGFPFLTGFYSKDVILERAYGQFGAPGHRAHLLGTAAAFFTAFYSRRLLYLTFLAEPHGYRSVRAGVHDAPRRRAIPLIILAGGSIVVGWLTRDRRIGPGTNFWNQALFVHPTHQIVWDAEFLPAAVKLTPVVCSLLGACSAYVLYRYGATTLWGWKRSWWGRDLYRFLNKKWRFDKVYQEWVTQRALDVAYRGTYLALDRGRFELVGPVGVSRVLWGGPGAGRTHPVGAVGARHSGQIYHASLRRLRGVRLVLAASLASSYPSLVYFLPVWVATRATK